MCACRLDGDGKLDGNPCLSHAGAAAGAVARAFTPPETSNCCIAGAADAVFTAKVVRFVNEENGTLDNINIVALSTGPHAGLCVGS